MKEPLPDGWILKTSRSQKGKQYFCNQSRKISLWSLPEVFAFERGLRQLENVSSTSSTRAVQELLVVQELFIMKENRYLSS